MDVLDYRRKRLEEEPIRLVNAIRSSLEVSKPHDKIDSSRQPAMEELEFRTVICEGVYDVTKNLYVGPRARSAVGVTQKGFFVITPLLSSEDSRRWEYLLKLNLSPLTEKSFRKKYHKSDVTFDLPLTFRSQFCFLGLKIPRHLVPELMLAEFSL